MVGERKYSTCSICKNIPDRASAFWVGGELRGDPLPKEEQHLVVVGAPYFRDSTSYTHHCLKQCPECGTFYDWYFEYEFLIPASEDEIILTRLIDEEGEQRAAQIMQEVERLEKKFIQEAGEKLKILLSSNHPGTLTEAADFIYMQILQGNNALFVLPGLVKALIRLSNRKDFDPAIQKIQFTIAPAIRSDPAAAQRLANILKQENIDLENPLGQQAQWLVELLNNSIK